MSGEGGERGPQTRETTYPLNSRRLTSRCVLRIAKGLGLPISASLADTRQMIEGRLVEKGHKPQNIEVHVIESEHGFSIRLNDEGGVVLEVPQEEESASRGVTPTSDIELETREEGAELEPATGSARGSGIEPPREDFEELRAELESARSHSIRLEAELKRVQGLAAEVSQLKERVRGEREKYSALWRMNCDRLVDHDSVMLAKEKEIDKLRARIEELEADSGARAGHIPARHPDAGHTGVCTETEPASPSPRRTPVEIETHYMSEHGLMPRREGDTAMTDLSGRLPHDVPVRGGLAVASYSAEGVRESSKPGKAVSVGVGLTPVRRGKAPPIDPFTGESPDVLFEDWYPALQRAAEWNNWSKGETLIQLAGYLRGRALQEWTLLSAQDKATLDLAVTNLRGRLDPCSRALAAQDFRHASQREGEPVADFIIRLEQMFKLAYGRDKLSDETRKMLLHSQLQEGLSYELMKSPAVSGSHSYPELCLAARNEEKRLVELMKSPAVSGSHSYPELCLAARNEEKRLVELAKRRLYHESTSSQNSPGIDQQRQQFPQFRKVTE